VNKKIVKVHIVKKVGVTVKQVKKAIKENKVVVTGKKVVVNKTVVEHKDTAKKVVEHASTHHKVQEHHKKVGTHKKVLENIVKEEHKQHKQIKHEIKHHASKCSCADAKTSEAKTKCRSECESRGLHLKKKVTEHVSKDSNCQRKAVIACGDGNSNECVKCQKSFILLCGAEETNRRNELNSLLDECDNFLLEPSVSKSYKTIVYQP